MLSQKQDDHLVIAASKQPPEAYTKAVLIVSIKKAVIAISLIGSAYASGAVDVLLTLAKALTP